MPSQSKSVPRILLIISHAVSWVLLLSGLILVGKSVFEIAAVQNVTPNSLSWSSAGFLLLLIGSLIHSCRNVQSLQRSNQITES
jgi:hypothetical protein